MSNSYRKGAAVSWSFAGKTAKGKVADRFERTVQRTFDGSKVVRKGTKDDPAYLVEQEDGAKALKLGSELKAG